MTSPISDPFQDAIMKAIVAQFFTPLQLTAPDGGYVQQRATPVMLVVEQLFQRRQGELLEAILAKIEVDVLAAKVAETLHAQLSAAPHRYSRYDDKDEAARRALNERVQNKLAELLAKDMHGKIGCQSEEQP